MVHYSYHIPVTARACLPPAKCWPALQLRKLFSCYLHGCPFRPQLNMHEALLVSSPMSNGCVPDEEYTHFPAMGKPTRRHGRLLRSRRNGAYRRTPHISANFSSVAFTRPATTLSVRRRNSTPSCGSVRKVSERSAPSHRTAVVLSLART